MIFISASPAGFTAEPVTASRAEKIEVDGRLDEPAWQEAEEYTIEFSVPGESPSVETSFRILWDADNLYLGVVAEQPDMDALRVEATGLDSNVWRDDSIEFFIDPGGEGGPYFQIMANAVGKTWENRIRRGRDSIAEWSARGLETAANHGEDFWTLEMRIPFADLLSRYEETEPQVNIESWRFNLARHYRGGSPSHLTYSPLSDNFDTDNYTPLRGIEIDYDRYRWRLRPAAIKEVIPEDDGTYRLELNLGIANLSERFQPFRLDGEARLSPEAKESFVIAEQFGADAGQTIRMPFVMEVPADGLYPVTIELLDPASDAILAWRRFELEVDTSPLKLEILHPFYRSAIYHDMEVEAVRLGLTSKWGDAPWRTGDTLRLRIMDVDGGTVSELDVDEPEYFVGDHELPIPDLAPGDYRCLAEILRQGERLYVADTSLSVYPPSESVVRVNEHRNIVINGRETFPVGTFHSPWARHQGQNCNISLRYGNVPDLAENPDARESYEALADEGRWMIRFPYPYSIIPHQSGFGGQERRQRWRMNPLKSEHADKIAELISPHQSTRGLFGYYLADEPNPTRFLPDYLEGVAAAVREADPYRPSYISFNNAGAVKHYNDACDIVGVHWYCMFTDDGPRSALSTVADHIKLAHEHTDHRKAVINSPLFWMYAPGGNVRMPTHDETRNMAYLGIVHGAKGTIWYAACGFHVGLEPRLGMPVLIDELRTLEPVFLAHKKVDISVTGEDAKAVHVQGKQLDGELYIIAVNADPDERSAVLQIPSDWADDGSIRELDSREGEHELENGVLTLDFAPYEVRIFSTCNSAPQLESREDVQRRFEDEHRRLLESGDLCYSGGGAALEASDDFGPYWRARLLINGYHDDTRFLPDAMETDSWVKITFAEPQEVGRIEIYSPEGQPFRDYRIELNTEDGWRQLGDAEISEEVVADGVMIDRELLRREHRFTGRRAGALRLVVTEEATGKPTGIRAFTP